MKAPLFLDDWPITQVFGVNPAKYAAWNLAGHDGIDFGCPLGTQLYCHVDADVIEVGYDPGGYGRYIKVRDHLGQDWLWAHLSDQGATKEGDALIASTPIGLSGSTGNATGPHLHFGYRPWPPLRGWPYDGWVDPLPWLLRAVASTGTGA